MGLHSIIEPAGTLMTGWELVPDCSDLIDIRNKDRGPVPDSADGDRTPAIEPASKWERRPVEEPSGRELRKVG